MYTNYINKKNILIYSYFFIITFSILFISNYFYKTEIINFSNGHNYHISSNQLNRFKSKQLDNYLIKIFNENSYKYSKPNISSNLMLTEESINSSFNFNLIINQKIDEKKLEDQLNKIHQQKIETIINELESSFEKFNYLSLDIAISTKTKNYSNEEEIIIDRNKFFLEKYVELTKVDALYELISYTDLNDSCIQGDSENCLQKIYSKLISVLEIAKKEINNLFKVEFINTIQIENNFIKDLPSLLGFSAIISYFLFIFRYLVFKKKKK